jgi:hypothetical protein
MINSNFLVCPTGGAAGFLLLKNENTLFLGHPTMFVRLVVAIFAPSDWEH